MESEIRGARLWLNERHEEQARLAAEIEGREKEIANREAALDAHANSPRASSRGPGPLAAEEADFAQRAMELDRRQTEIDAMAARLVDKVAVADRAQDQDQSVRALEARRAQLERVEKLLAEDQARISETRRALEDERAALGEASLADRRKLAEEHERAAAELEQAQRELARQSDELAARHSALERMRSDVALAQREALEVRLATEELWARLCGTMAPASLAQSLAQIRLKLADEQRLARDELSRQKSEVQMLSARLAEQHRKLSAEREELQNWATQRQRELERQAASLAAGQRRIDQERIQFSDRSAQWQSERFALQAEIRRLLRQHDRGESAAA
jgi:DNA repair exonuclease SbcCD ATPase subunit